jgi:hypothetical protein
VIVRTTLLPAAPVAAFLAGTPKASVRVLLTAAGLPASIWPPPGDVKTRRPRLTAQIPPA